MKRIRIGNNLAITWILFEEDGNIHNLEGRELELYMTCGGFKYPVTDYTVTENAIAWAFPAKMQTKTGYYKLVLLENDSTLGLHSFDVKEAFCLEPEDALTNIGTIIDRDCAINVRSVLTYAHITNLASVDVVDGEDGKTVVVHLTNGKSFTIPAGAWGSGSGSGSGSSARKIILLQEGYQPEWERSDDLYYFTPEQDSYNYSEKPSLGDVLWYLGDTGYLWAYEVVRVDTNNFSPTGETYVCKLTVDEMDIFTGVRTEIINRLDSLRGDAALSASMGNTLRQMIATVLTTVATADHLGLIKIGYPESGNNYAVKLDGRNRAYVTVPGGGSGGEGGGSGADGRSIVSVQNWYKLTADESVQATPMNIADPASVAGGSWSLTAGSPTVEYPYLRCFMQVNYDTPLENGYTYTRSSAFTARYFNSDSSQEYNDLVEALANLRTELQNDLAGYEADLEQLNNALEALRTTISGNITNTLNELRNRLNQINGTDVEQILNEGLWAVLTSWTNETGSQKAFSDIILNAETAKALIQTGSTFFDHSVGGSVTLDGILGQLSAKVTRQDVNSMIASAQFSMDPSSLNSVISKSQACWKKNGVLYPYDLYLTDYMANHTNATLADYEEYMTSAPSADGPAGDSTRPAGPFELVVVVEQFSNIKQTVDEISASVDKVKYMWRSGNDFKSYDAFETEYANRASRYSSYTYEQFVTNILGYERIEVGSALSNITQTEDEIKSILGDVGYFWRRPTTGGGYEYQQYAVPSNQTRDQYVAAMQSAGWELVTYASRMSVIDQFPDSITSLVKNSTLCWIDSAATGAAYSRAYDYWLSEYNMAVREVSYEEYVAANYPSYTLTVVTDSFSRIKQESDRITSAVSSVNGFDSRLSAVEQTADELSLSVSKANKCWKSNEDGTIVEYGYFLDEYNQQTRTVSYEAWVANTKNHTLSDSFTEVSGIKIQSDKVWAAVGDGDNVKASIEIIGDADTDSGKIILDADNVIINGGLRAGVVTAGSIAADAVTSDKIAANAIVTETIDALAVTAAKIAAGAVTTDKIQAGSITADKIAAGALNAIVANILHTLTVGTYSKIVLEDGLIKVYDANNLIWMEIGKSSSDSTPVIKVYGRYDENNNWVPLYDLGPNGIVWRGDDYQYDSCKLGERIVLGRLCNIGATVSGVNTSSEGANIRNGYHVFTPARKSKSGVATQYYNYNQKQGDGVSGHGWVSFATIQSFYSLLVKTDQTYALRPNGANAEIEVWPKIETSLLADKPSDGWYLDNTDGFLSNYRGTVDDTEPAEEDPEEEENP